MDMKKLLKQSNANFYWIMQNFITHNGIVIIVWTIVHVIKMILIWQKVYYYIR